MRQFLNPQVKLYYTVPVRYPTDNYQLGYKLATMAAQLFYAHQLGLEVRMSSVYRIQFIPHRSVRKLFGSTDPSVTVNIVVTNCTGSPELVCKVKKVGTYDSILKPRPLIK
jgi:hypothetical protein